MRMIWTVSVCFFFNDTATTEIYTLSLHDALPIFGRRGPGQVHLPAAGRRQRAGGPRSEEHTSELQSRQYLVCRLLLEKKNSHTGDDLEIVSAHHLPPFTPVPLMRACA